MAPNLDKVKISADSICLYRTNKVTTKGIREALSNMTPLVAEIAHDDNAEFLSLPRISEIFFTYFFNTSSVPSKEHIWDCYCRNVLPKYERKFSKSLRNDIVKSLVEKEYKRIVEDVYVFYTCLESGLFPGTTCFLDYSKKEALHVLIPYKQDKYILTFFANAIKECYYKVRNKKSESSMMITLEKGRMTKVGGYLLCPEDFPCDVLNKIGRNNESY